MFDSEICTKNMRIYVKNVLYFLHLYICNHSTILLEFFFVPVLPFPPFCAERF